MSLCTILFVFVTASRICVPVGSNPSIVSIGYMAESSFLDGHVGNVQVTTEDSIALEKIGFYCQRDYTKTSEPLYYYPYNPSDGKFTKIRQMRNDVDSLNYSLKQAEKKVSTLDGTTTYYTFQPVANYVRTINNNYSRSGGSSLPRVVWDMACGRFSADQNHEIDRHSNYGLNLNDFFGSFVDSSSFNSIDHSQGSLPLRENGLLLIDPFVPSKGIDLTHMFAPICASYPNSIYEETNKWVRALASWGGDLQTEAQFLLGIRVQNFEDVLNNNIRTGLDDDDNSTFRSFFLYPDLAADMDGINIVNYQQSAVEASHFTTFSDVFGFYYSNTTLQQRYRSFVHNVASETWLNCSGDDAIKFQKTVFDILHLGLSLTGATSEISGGIFPVNSDSFVVDDYKYYLLQRNNHENGDAYRNMMPSIDTRRDLAVAFCKHILLQAGFSAEVICQ